MKTLHGLYAHGFPSLFHMGSTQNTLTPNFPHMLDEQAFRIADVVRRAGERQAAKVEVTPEGEAEWIDTIKRNALQNAASRAECTPGYYNGEGRAGAGFLDGLYGPGSVAFFELAREWRAKEDMPGLSVG